MGAVGALKLPSEPGKRITEYGNDKQESKTTLSLEIGYKLDSGRLISEVSFF